MSLIPHARPIVHSATRRDVLKFALAAGGASLWPLRSGAAATPAGALITRPIPSSGQRLPAVGLGSSATFARTAGGDEAQRLREVFENLVRAGGTVFDTAPAYGASEEVAGRLVQEAGLAGKLFWATKLNVARGTGTADPEQARA